MKKKIIIFTGDPNSINSQIIFKSWSKLKKNIKEKIYFVSNYDLIKSQFKTLNLKLDLKKVSNINTVCDYNKLKILNVDLKFKDSFNVKKNAASNYIKKSLEICHKLSLKNEVLGLINCPIRKTLLHKSRFGITEYLASKCNIKKGGEVMMIGNKNLSVSPITTHLDVKEVSTNLRKEIIINKVKTINKWFTRENKKKPKIAILGLNPHNGELRKDTEEKKLIIPAITKLKKAGVRIYGPYVADTIFINDYKKFNVIVGMYHDQVLAPFKALYKFDAINFTLGLKYLRASPDHGVASDLIFKNNANPLSLIKCIEFINNS